MADAAYHFLSFVRSGFAASITQPDTLGPNQPALSTAPVGVAVSGVTNPITHQAIVRGPGDVVGLTPSQVVRTDPIDGAVGVEPNYFAQVEFDRPDLPWLFTPAAAVGERLRPWLVLVVVDLDGDHPCSLSAGSPLPQLRVPADAAAQLPDLASSYLWAHAQVVNPDAQTVAAALAGDPRLTVSRLICPRHLQPLRWYLAAIVPAFAVGCLAGLGQPVAAADEARLDPAWQPGAAVELPVYHSFQFKTGEDADFESLARKITGRPVPGVGTRALDVSRPGAGIPSLPTPVDVHDQAAIVSLEGALRAVDPDTPHPQDPSAENAFRASLTVLLDRPATLRRGGNVDAVVAPPIYGDKHALVVELGAGTPPPWIVELNLDPRTRVAAGLATQVVQSRQDDLVARAWRQLGDVLAANRLLRAAQLARSSSLPVHGRLSTLDAPSLLAVASPVHSRVVGVTGAAVTLAKVVRQSRLPDVAVQPAFRRLLRPAAAIARTAGAPGLAATVVSRFASEPFTAPIGGPDGVSSMRAASEVIGAARASEALTALGDAQPEAAARLDTVLATLDANAKPLPTGEEIRAAARRTDVTPVSLVGSFGALPATAVSAALAAASVSAPPPTPPVRPTPGPVRGIAVLSGPSGNAPGQAPSSTLHLPQGLAKAIDPPVAAPGRGARGVIIFEPPGGDRGLGDGVVLRGGTIVVATDTVRQIVDGAVNVRGVEDARWAALQRDSAVPTVIADADPVTDPGTRLDGFRRDPGALLALAQLADGHIDATLILDAAAARQATAGAGAASLQNLASGTFTVPLPQVAATGAGPSDVAAVSEMIAAAAAAFERFATLADAPPRAAGAVLDLDAARGGLLGKLDPETTVAARVRVRLRVGAIAGVAARDELDPVMACPRFLDPMWEAVRDLGSGWLLPGLELVPPDTATLVRTNPSFVVSHLVGLNHEFMRELLWREYPTDQRGTAFARFWGRSGDHPDDIGPVHLFAGALEVNLLVGQDGEAVLLVRSELLRRYPGSIIYLCRATQQGPTLALDDATIVLPTFHGDLPPDVSFVGFPISPETLRAGGDPWWFVIAQPPTEPRFGLDEPSAGTPAIPSSAGDLAWSHMSADGPPATTAAFAPADPPLLRGHPIDGLTWGASAAIQAHLTYQHPVRVAIRAADLLPATPSPPPLPAATGGSS